MKPGPPPSSPSLNNPPSRSASSCGACPPPLGASGVSHLFRFSPLPFDGNEGKNSGCFGWGSSLKYGCRSASAAEIRLAGSRVRRELSKSAPELVRRGPIRARNNDPVLLSDVNLRVYVCRFCGKLRSLEFGRSLNAGQVSSVGIPTNSKIYKRQTKEYTLAS